MEYTYSGKGGIPEDVKNVYVADGVTSIPERAFQDCQFLEEVSGCRDVREVGDRAFIYCPRLSKVSFPLELENFGFFAFFGCTELQRLANSQEQRDLVSFLKDGKKNSQELSEESEPLSMPESSKIGIDSARSRGRRKSSILDDFKNDFQFAKMARQYASSVHEVVSEGTSTDDEEREEDDESWNGTDRDDDLEVLDKPERLTEGSTITLDLDETAVESGARTLNHSQSTLARVEADRSQVWDRELKALKRETLTLLDEDMIDEDLEALRQSTNPPSPYSSVRLSSTFWSCEKCDEEGGVSIPEHKIDCPACGTVRPGKEELDALKTRIRRSMSAKDQYINDNLEDGVDEDTDEKVSAEETLTLEDDAKILVHLWSELNGDLAALYDGNEDDPSLWLGVTVQEGRVVGLAWYEENLTGEIPEEFEKLTALQHLDMSDNALTGEIPASLGNLRELTGLALSFNQLSGTIPKELFNLLNMVNLRLQANKLEGRVPEEICNLQMLQELSLDSNDFEGEIPNISTIKTLNLVALDKNKFEQHNMRSSLLPITKTLGNNFVADEGVISANIVTELKDDAEAPLSEQKAKLLRQDAQIVLSCWLNLGKDEKWLRMDAGDDISKWYGVTVESNRISRIDWSASSLRGTVPQDFSELTALIQLNLTKNPQLKGEVGGKLLDLRRKLGLSFRTTLKNEKPEGYVEAEREVEVAEKSQVEANKSSSNVEQDQIEHEDEEHQEDDEDEEDVKKVFADHSEEVALVGKRIMKSIDGKIHSGKVSGFDPDAGTWLVKLTGVNKPEEFGRDSLASAIKLCEDAEYDPEKAAQILSGEAEDDEDDRGDENEDEDEDEPFVHTEEIQLIGKHVITSVDGELLAGKVTGFDADANPCRWNIKLTGGVQGSLKRDDLLSAIKLSEEADREVEIAQEILKERMGVEKQQQEEEMVEKQDERVLLVEEKEQDEGEEEQHHYEEMKVEEEDNPYIGKMIMKPFDGIAFKGTVLEYVAGDPSKGDSDDARDRWLVEYRDGDSEDVFLDELKEMMKLADEAGGDEDKGTGITRKRRLTVAEGYKDKKVMKPFDTDMFGGVVIDYRPAGESEVESDEKVDLWTVRYEDGDEEDVELDELQEMIELHEGSEGNKERAWKILNGRK